jgi:hypothetical protein
MLCCAVLCCAALSSHALSTLMLRPRAAPTRMAGVNPVPENGEEGVSPSLGTGLYELACRAAHSCTPNSNWFSDSEGRRVIHTLVDVAAGEEVGAVYIS